jgi:uncharacterized protein (TIGR02145 family)
MQNLNIHNMKNAKVNGFHFILVLIVSSLINNASAQTLGTVQDQDGNTYKTVKIGAQIWMAENLRTTKFTDGTSIPLVSDKNAWIILSGPAYCWYNNDTLFKSKYGALYNGYAISTGKLCPAGWHISTDVEWTTMVELLGGENVAGGKMKESGTKNWLNPNTGATNESGFNSLPGGTRYGNGLFFSEKSAGSWWTVNKSNSLNGWYRSMNHASTTVTRNFIDLTNGFSVRCIKD